MHFRMENNCSLERNDLLKQQAIIAFCSYTEGVVYFLHFRAYVQIP